MSVQRSRARRWTFVRSQIARERTPTGKLSRACGVLISVAKEYGQVERAVKAVLDLAMQMEKEAKDAGDTGRHWA